MTVTVPAVAVVAKAPGWAPVKSRLQPPLTPDEARALATAFLLDRLDGVAALTDVAAVLAFAPPEAADALRTLTPAPIRLLAQRGDDLGARLAHLFDDLLAAHPAAIALDADSPTLPLSWVVDGLDVLMSGDADVVLGPSDDGGYWSIGLRTRCAALFHDVPWSTDQVLSTTIARAEALGLRLRRLPRWFDIDTPTDLRRLCDDVREHGGPWRTASLVPALAARLATGVTP